MKKQKEREEYQKEREDYMKEREKRQRSKLVLLGLTWASIELKGRCNCFRDLCHSFDIIHERKLLFVSITYSHNVFLLYKEAISSHCKDRVTTFTIFRTSFIESFNLIGQLEVN